VSRRKRRRRSLATNEEEDGDGNGELVGSSYWWHNNKSNEKDIVYAPLTLDGDGEAEEGPVDDDDDDAGDDTILSSLNNDEDSVVISDMDPFGHPAEETQHNYWVPHSKESTRPDGAMGQGQTAYHPLSSGSMNSFSQTADPLSVYSVQIDNGPDVSDLPHRQPSRPPTQPPTRLPTSPPTTLAPTEPSHVHYPLWSESFKGCAASTSPPIEYAADAAVAAQYLFGTKEECCREWFGNGDDVLAACMDDSLGGLPSEGEMSAMNADGGGDGNVSGRTKDTEWSYDETEDDDGEETVDDYYEYIDDDGGAYDMTPSPSPDSYWNATTGSPSIGGGNVTDTDIATDIGNNNGTDVTDENEFENEFEDENESDAPTSAVLPQSPDDADVLTPAIVVTRPPSYSNNLHGGSESTTPPTPFGSSPGVGGAPTMAQPPPSPVFDIELPTVVPTPGDAFFDNYSTPEPTSFSSSSISGGDETDPPTNAVVAPPTDATDAPTPWRTAPPVYLPPSEGRPTRPAAGSSPHRRSPLLRPRRPHPSPTAPKAASSRIPRLRLPLMPRVPPELLRCRRHRRYRRLWRRRPTCPPRPVPQSPPQSPRRRRLRREPPR